MYILYKIYIMLYAVNCDTCVSVYVVNCEHKNLSMISGVIILMYVSLPLIMPFREINKNINVLFV